MSMNDESNDPTPLRQAAEIAIDYLADLAKRPGGRPIEAEPLPAPLGGDLPERGEAPEVILERLVRDVDPGLVAPAGPRYFGFVIGGSLPVTRATGRVVDGWEHN